MTRNKKIIIPALALITLLGAGAYGVSRASADEMGSGMTSLVEKISTKFGLNKDEVQKVFEEERDERQTQMKARYEERLNEAVSKGELTEEQEKLLLAKREEMQTEREKNRENHQNLSMEERKAEMEKRRTELEQWAKDNGIDVKYLMMGPGGMARGGHGGFMRGAGNGN